MNILDVTEESSGGEFDDFIEFCKQKLGLESIPPIDFCDNVTYPDGSSVPTFGRYSHDDDSDTAIQIHTKGRHKADVMRTIAHELVHCKQHGTADHELDGSDGSADEDEANAEAGVILRKWADQDPEMFTEGTINEEFFSTVGWWMLTNPLVIAKILLVLAALWQVATIAAGTYASYKTLKWTLRKIGIMDDPKEVVKKAKANPSYMKRLSHKLANHFKNNRDDARKTERAIKADMKNKKQATA